MNKTKVLFMTLIALAVIWASSSYAFAAGKNNNQAVPLPPPIPASESSHLPDYLVPVINPTPQPPESLDPAISSWAKADVEWMINKAVVPESLQGNYKKYITREEYASLVYNVLNYFTEKYKGEGYVLNIPRYTKFTDIDTPMVNTAYSVGIINGVTSTEFRPRALITREQGAVMMANMLATVSVPGLSNEDFGFADKLSISKWAIDAVNICGNAGIFMGTGEGFRPSDHYTREQAILTVKRLIDASYGEVDTLKLRNQVELPIDSIGGGLVVGDAGIKFLEPANPGDQSFMKFVEGLSKILSAATIEKLRNLGEVGTLQDGSFTVRYRPFVGHDHSLTGHKEIYLVEIEW